jgi:hypothetical protein
MLLELGELHLALVLHPLLHQHLHLHLLLPLVRHLLLHQHLQLVLHLLWEGLLPHLVHSAVLEALELLLMLLLVVMVLEEAELVGCRSCCKVSIRVITLLPSSFGRSQLVHLDHIALEVG